MRLHISVHIMILPLAWQLQIAGNHQIIVAVAALSNVDFSAHEEGNEDSESTFDDNFDSAIPIFPNDQDDSSQYLKRSPGPTGITSRQTTTGYDTGYPSRVSDNSYSRFDQLQASQGLCT